MSYVFGRGAAVLALVCCLLASAQQVRADVEGARREIDKAAEQIKSGSLNEAKTSLQLAEAQLEDVDPAAAGPLKEQIAALRKSMTDAANAEARVRLDRDMERLMRNLRESIGTDAWESESRNVEEAINDPANKALLGEDADKLLKEIATMRKVNAGQMLDKRVEEADRWLKSAEEEWPGKIAEIKAANDLQQRSMFQSAESDLARIERILTELPADNEKVKPLQARYNKLKTEYESVATAATSANELARLKDYLESVTRDGQGWESEAGDLTFDKYKMTTGNTDMDRLGLPKTVEFREGADRFLEGLAENEQYKAIADNPDVKAFIETVKKKRQTAYDRILASAKKVVDEAERAPLDDNTVSGASRLSGGGARGALHIALGDESPDLKALVDRADGLVKKREEASAAADAAKEKAYQDMKAAADKAWPDLVSKYSDAKEGFDPNSAGSMKGQFVRIKAANRMGWDFSPGDFPFAITLNGVPVAGKYDPEVAAAIKEVEEKTGFRFESRLDEGDWDLIARVDGTTGKLSKKVQGEIRGDGGGSLRYEESQTVDAPIITIVAAKCGALAVAAGAGMAKSDGTVAAATGAPAAGGSSSSAAGSSARGWFWLVLTLLVGLAAAAACLMKANFAPLASIPQAGDVQTKLGGQNLAVIGLVCAAIGLILLLKGFVIYGLLTHLAIIAAGLYAAMDWLAAKGILSEQQVAQIRPLGVPIGLACAALVVVRLLAAMLSIPLYII